MGLETGDDVTLKAINKGATAQTMIDMGKKARAAGIKLSITVLLGLAGRERSQTHARETGRVLSAIDPEYVGALSLMLIPGTPMYDDHQAGRFELIEADEMLAELRTMIAETHQSQGLFHANHASNYLPIRARMPKGQGEDPGPDRCGPERQGGPAAGVDAGAVNLGGCYFCSRGARNQPVVPPNRKAAPTRNPSLNFSNRGPYRFQAPPGGGPRDSPRR